jgi:hypothetical protein
MAVGCGYGSPWADNFFTPTSYRWELRYNLGAAIEGDALSGEIDVRARVRFVFFSRTFSKRLANIPGFNFRYVLAEEEVIGELPKEWELGALTPEITFPQITVPPLSAFPTTSQFTLGMWFEDLPNTVVGNARRDYALRQYRKLIGVSPMSTIDAYGSLKAISGATSCLSVD